MMHNRAILLILAIGSVIFILGQLFFVPKTYVNSAIVAAITAPGTLVKSLTSTHAIVEQLTRLQLENQSLRGQLFAAENRPGITKERSMRLLSAETYSTYPLNNTGTLFIGAGSAEGVAIGMPVLAARGIFLGEIMSVGEHSSQVRTLYDAGWELPVKIGPHRVDSLLVGGHEPRLTLISKKRPIEHDMLVYSASREHGGGLLLGAVSNPSDSDKGLFQEGRLQLPYLISDTHSVLVVLGE